MNRSGRSRRRAAVWLAAALAVLASGFAISFSAARPDVHPTVITVGRATVGRAIPDGFVGLSMEYRGLEAYVGPDPSALSPVFLQLLRNLAPAQRPVLRIGGDSSDWTSWPVAGVPTPPGVKYVLDRRWIRVARAVTRALDARLILGVNLEADSPRLAAGEAQAFLTGIGRSAIDALEVGNEPELYGSFPWYKTAAGQHVRGRPHGYWFAGYMRDFSAFAAALPPIPLAGPSTGSPSFSQSLAPFLAGQRRVGLATLHAYPLKNCSGFNGVTMAQLLSDTSSAGLADSMAPYVRIARRHGIGLRIDEMNAVTCGGQRGVSDTFASALWSLKALFEMARVGVAGVNVHTVPRTINEVIGSTQAGGVWQSAVHPEYYGLMMFAQAAPANSRLLRVSGSTAGVRVYATRAPDGHVRVVLINVTAGSRAVAVRIPAGRAPATLERLEAPSLHAKLGVTLGGQSFGPETTTGLLGGRPSSVAPSPDSGGYEITLPADSAALLTQ